MKITKLLHLGSALIVSLSSLFVINFGTALAAVNNCTWTGTNSNNFNDAGNWTSCNSTVPQAGDNLIFDNTSLAAATTLTNDITNLSAGNISFTGTGSYDYTLSGNAMTLTGGLTAASSVNPTISVALNISGAQTFDVGYIVDVKGALSGSGPLTVTGADGGLWLEGDNSSFSGGISTAAALISAMSPTALGTGTTTITNGGALALDFDTDTTFSTPLSLGGDGNASSPGSALYLSTINMAGDKTVATLSGPVTLTSDIKVGAFGYRTLKVTGPLSGQFAMAPLEGDSNAIIDIESSNNTSNTASGILPISVDSTDKQSSLGFTAYDGITYILDGQRGDGTVNSGGILKGTGTAGNLTVDTGGTVAPGHSPGCLSTGNLTLKGTYQAEIGGTTACSGYDQLNVTGTVDVTGATLDTILYNNYKPKAGETYTIIKNDGTDKVTGTFNGLAEGATFKVGTYVFKITYKGGTGNDVVLSIVTTPKTPDTGFAFTGANPTATLAGSVLAAGTLLLIGRKTKLAFERR